ncbi:MAG: hypothetical protein QXM99_06320, partial [Thermofilum sp.]
MAVDKALELVVRKVEKGERLKPEDLAVLTIAVVRDMSRRIDETNKRIDLLADSLNARITELDERLNRRIAELDERLNRRIDLLDEKLSKRIDETNKRIDGTNKR